MMNLYAPIDQTGVVLEGLDIGHHVAEISRQGYSIVENFLDEGLLQQINAAFNTQVPITEMRAIGTDTGRTWRAHNLLAKTRAADDVFLDKRLRAIVDGVLGKYNQINITTLFNTLPGETKQRLHQDDGLWPIPRPHPAFLCNALIAFDDFTIENGATHLVPFSHTWHDREVDQSVETIQIEMSRGSMVLWEGAMWHAGGANNSQGERMGFFLSHQLSYLRPQEIQLLAIPADEARKLPIKLQRLIGYHPFGIGVDGRDPIDVLADGRVISPDAHLAEHWRSQE
ncbi:MAG: ectoine hydroxylase-related dioxygenase (phytanoyl-CoA dioxygenase family) [Candidatus Azotimanducaceae bacterium]|jgi:ectoine hydroxylase-related dioxygenase (phytanoyl-CoA dioxygenase family)